MTYTVKQLTGMNVQALRATVGNDPRVVNIGETVATFTSAQAGLDLLDDVMRYAGTHRRSLHAVHRKLADAVAMEKDRPEGGGEPPF